LISRLIDGKEHVDGAAAAPTISTKQLKILHKYMKLRDPNLRLRDLLKGKFADAEVSN